MSEVWTKWQGHVIDGTFPLNRYLGGSDHSGVFLVELGGREPPEVAIKLVPVTEALGEAYLEHWDTAAGLDHPHLVRILQTGRCELDGLPFVYAVMEYSDQNLAQLLEHRAMTEDEAREMLPPVLSALSFLHNRNLVQGQLKPSNILVVGDQVKLASDTICRVSEVTGGVNMVSIYDPPEAGDGRSAAGDIWALGVSLFEALTRSPSLALDVRRGGVVLPPDFSPTFRDIVSLCLSRRPYDRPKLTEIEARLRGQVSADPVVYVGEGAAPATAEARGEVKVGAGAAPVGSQRVRAVAPAVTVSTPVGFEGVGSAGAPVVSEAMAASERMNSEGVGAATAPVAAEEGVAASAPTSSEGGGPVPATVASEAAGAGSAPMSAERVEAVSAPVASEEVVAASLPMRAEGVGAVPAPVAPREAMAASAPTGSEEVVPASAVGAPEPAHTAAAPVASGEIEAIFAPGMPEGVDETSAPVTSVGAAASAAPKGVSGGVGSVAGVGTPAGVAPRAPVGGSATPGARQVSPAVGSVPVSSPAMRPTPARPSSTSAGGAHPAPTSTSASGTYRAPDSTSVTGVVRVPPPPPTGAISRAPLSTSATGTHRAAASTSASGTYRAPQSNPATGAQHAPVSTSTSGTYRAPPSTSATGAPHAPVSTSTSGTYRAPPSISATGTHRALDSTSATGTHRAPVSTSTSGTYRAPPPASATGTQHAPVSTSTSGTYRVPPSTSAAGNHAPLSTSATGTHRAPVSTSITGSHRALDSTSATGTHRAPVGTAPIARVAAPAAAAPARAPAPGAASALAAGHAQAEMLGPPAIFTGEPIFLPGTGPVSAASRTQAAAKAPAPATSAPATAAPGLPSPPFRPTPSGTIKAAPAAAPEPNRAVPKSTLSPQRQWTSAEEITVRSATSEPAVLQRIIGQPVVVMPSAAKRMQAEDALYDDETSTEDAPAEESSGRPSTQQRYLILVGLVTAVIVPLCWAGLGGLRPHRDRTVVEAPQAPPQQSAAVATPIVRSQPDPAAPESEVTSTDVMHPGDAATPAGGAADVDNGAVPGSPTTAIDRAGASATIPVANRAGMSGSATPVDRAATPVGTAAAAGASMSASRSADYSHGDGTSDNTNMTAGSGGSAEPSSQHQEFPEIPSRIRQTIHGHVKVSVRVIVDEGGSVFAALIDSPGPSRYFERAAIEAAKKWTFPPADSTSRLKLVQFDFTRDGTTGQAIELQ